MMKKYLEYAVNTLVDLVKIPTVNPPGENYQTIALFLKQELESLGFEVELIEIPESYLNNTYPYAPLHHGKPRYVVWGSIGYGRAIQFNGHYDVVVPGERWSTDPFVPVIKDGRIYGRGTTDMKGGIAVTLAALKYAVEMKLVKDVKVEVAFVPDEESGGMGSRYLLEEKEVDADYVVISEPTTSEYIGIAHKGFARGIVEVVGRQGHASRPWKSVNAFEKACELVSDFLPRYWKLLEGRRTSYPTDEQDAACPSISLGGYTRSPTEKDNIIPGAFEFSFDRRIIPEENEDKVAMELLKYLRDSAARVGAKFEVTIKSLIAPSATPMDSHIVTLMEEVIQRTLGFCPKLKLNAGRWDLVYYRKAGIEGVVYGPGVKGQAHAVNEYTTIGELERVLKVYVYFLENVSRLWE